MLNASPAPVELDEFSKFKEMPRDPERTYLAIETASVAVVVVAPASSKSVGSIRVRKQTRSENRKRHSPEREVPDWGERG